MMITEKLADTVMVYLIIKKLSTPFEEWPAFEMGLIDDNGKKLKEPKSFKERDAWTVFDRFIANLKRIMQRFVGKSRFAAVATSAFLLKDSHNILITKQLLNENIEITAIEQLAVHNAVNLAGIDAYKEPFNETHFRFMIDKYIKEIEKLDSDGYLDFLKMGEFENE